MTKEIRKYEPELDDCPDKELSFQKDLLFVLGMLVSEGTFSLRGGAASYLIEACFAEKDREEAWATLEDNIRKYGGHQG